MLQGALIGGVSGGIFSGVESAVYSQFSICSASQAVTASAVSGAAGGAAAGATASALYGGDVGQGALTGGIMGGLGAFGTPNYSPFGDSAAGSIGNRLFNSSLTGGSFGATYAGITGGDVWQGAGQGAFAWASGEAANMMIGHTVGFIGSGFNGPSFNNGAFYYDTGFDGWITFGNVISGPSAGLNDVYSLPGGRRFTYGEHELGHLPQGTLLGPAYIPAHATSLTVGGTIGMFTGAGIVKGSHQYGVLERYYHPTPAY